MSKFCGNCGASLSDDAAFCTSCGAAAGNTNVQQTSGAPMGAMSGGQSFYQNDQTAPAQQGYIAGGNPAGAAYGQLGVQGAAQGAGRKININKNMLIIGGALLVLIILLIVVISIIAGGSYKDPLDNYVKVCEEGDADAYLDTVYAGDSSLLLSSDYEENALDIHNDFLEDYGIDAEVEYEVKKKKALSDTELAVVNVLATDKVKAKKGYRLTVQFTYKGSEGMKKKNVPIVVVKSGDGWKLYDRTVYGIYYYD